MSRTSSAKSGNASNRTAEVVADAVGRDQLLLADKPVDRRRASTRRSRRRGRDASSAAKYRFAISAVEAIVIGAVYACRNIVPA